MRNKIICGGTEIGDSVLLSGNVYLSSKISLDELTIDTMEHTFVSHRHVMPLFAPRGKKAFRTSDQKLLAVPPTVFIEVVDVSAFSPGKPVLYYRDEDLVGKFYMDGITRVGKHTYKISCKSAVGFLDRSIHYGGIYGADIDTVQNVINELVGGSFAFRIESSIVANSRVYGWLPIATRRENLHQLLFAEGLYIDKDDNGDIIFRNLGSEEITISESKMFLGGSVDYGNPASRALVTEHSYISLSDDEEKTLFDGFTSVGDIISPNGTEMNGTLITFDGPYHDLHLFAKDEGGNRVGSLDALILESGVNYCVIGSYANCMLTGRRYTHTTRIVQRDRPSAFAMIDSKNSDVLIENATLVSPVNSENVADRIINFYGSAIKSNADIIVGSRDPGTPARLEKPGMNINYTDPFGDAFSGYLQSLDIKVSGILRASAEMIAGYTPVDPGNNFNHVVVLTGHGTYDLPPYATNRLRIVLIGGGDGGEPGANGAKGGGGTTAQGVSGEGGLGGKGGKGGNIYLRTIEADKVESFNYSCGTGGAPGERGTRTDLTIINNSGASVTISSDDGINSSIGYVDVIESVTYGVSGKDGVNGASGQQNTDTPGADVVFNGVTYHSGAPGNGVGTAQKQGLGGGAAAGRNGWPGKDAEYYETKYYGTFVQGGDGGNGASATLPGKNGVHYGDGGDGGNGGGGGGGGGCGTHNIGLEFCGRGGNGGGGSIGGSGMNGCILIYINGVA